MRVLRREDKKVIVENLMIADRFLSRLKGLMLSKALPSNAGLLLKPCQSVHTFFMNYTIDVIFLDENNRIIGIENNMRPYHISKFYRKSQKVLEMNAGIIDLNNLKIGDNLELEGYEK